jgi:hypothetical protein
MTLLKSMNIYEGLDENKSEKEGKSINKNVVVMANNG